VVSYRVFCLPLIDASNRFQFPKKARRDLFMHECIDSLMHFGSRDGDGVNTSLGDEDEANSPQGMHHKRTDGRAKSSETFGILGCVSLTNGRIIRYLKYFFSFLVPVLYDHDMSYLLDRCRGTYSYTTD
jgi:hypothetical protein